MELNLLSWFLLLPKPTKLHFHVSVCQGLSISWKIFLHVYLTQKKKQLSGSRLVDLLEEGEITQHLHAVSGSQHTSYPGRKKAPSTFSKSLCSYCTPTFWFRENSPIFSPGKSPHQSNLSPRLQCIDIVPIIPLGRYQRRDTWLVFISNQSSSPVIAQTISFVLLQAHSSCLITNRCNLTSGGNVHHSLPTQLACFLIWGTQHVYYSYVWNSARYYTTTWQTIWLYLKSRPSRNAICKSYSCQNWDLTK